MQAISFQSFRWDRRPVQKCNPSSVPYTAWIPTGMPRVPDTVLDVVCFMYASTYDADAGTNTKGSGFVCGYPYQADHPEPLSHCYIVTNTHVVKDAPVARLTKSDGTTETFGTCIDDWECDDLCDIAAMSFSVDSCDCNIPVLDCV